MRRTYLTIVIFVAVVSLLSLFPGKSAAQSADAAYKQSKEYLALRDSVYNSFNNADSTRFFVATVAIDMSHHIDSHIHLFVELPISQFLRQLRRQFISFKHSLAIELEDNLIATLGVVGMQVILLKQIIL